MDPSAKKEVVVSNDQPILGVCVICRHTYGGEFGYPITKLTDEEYARVSDSDLGYCEVCAGDEECDESLCGDCPAHCSAADMLAEEKKRKKEKGDV